MVYTMKVKVPTGKKGIGAQKATYLLNNMFFGLTFTSLGKVGDVVTMDVIPRGEVELTEDQMKRIIQSIHFDFYGWKVIEFKPRDW